MRIWLTGIWIIVASVTAYSQDVHQKGNFHFRDVSFENFAQEIEHNTGVHLYFRSAWTDSLKVNLSADDITVLDVVELAVQGKGLGISVWNNQIVLLPSATLQDTLPDYVYPAQEKDDHSDTDQSLTASEERYLSGRLPDAINTISVGKKAPGRPGSKVTVQGRIIDDESGEPLSFATVFITETGTATAADINGFFNLSLRPGTYNVLFEYLGYQKQRIVLDVQGEGEFSIRMNKAVIQIKELIVRGDRQLDLIAKDPGFEKITMKSVKELPTLMGERNIIQISALLPGIVNTGEGSSGINVRGGNFDQNLFYFNRIPIYNTSHMFGFFPAFNADIVKDFAVYKGYIPAEYGGRLSSVFAINGRQGNLRQFSLHGGLSPITANLVAEGPLKKDVCSFILSGRTSYSDWILKNIKDPDIRSSKANFYDFSAGVHYDIQKLQVNVTAYHSFDHFRLSDLTDFQYQNSGVSLLVSRRPGKTLSTDYSLVAYQYSFTTIDQQEVSSAYRHDYALGHYEARADFRWLKNEKHNINFGAGVLLYDVDRGAIKPYGAESLHKETGLGKERGLETSLYAADAFDINSWMTATFGFRFVMYNPLGPATVYKYYPGELLPDNIMDSVTYGSFKAIKWYAQPDLRASVNIKTDVNGSLKLAYTHAYQNLFLLSNTVSLSPNAQWKLSDYYLKPAANHQVSAGVFRLLPHLGLEASLEVYYKFTRNFTEFKDGAEFIGIPQVETQVLQGNQKAYGIEAFLRRTGGKLEGWLSYTWSRSLVHVDGAEAFDKINNGAVYPSNYDLPHVVNLVATYHFTRRITLSFISTYQSGKPVTYPVSVYYVGDIPNLDYSDRNAYRIPDYFRTDASLTLEGNLRKNKLVHSSFVISVYNLTGRKNPYAVYYRTANGRINSYRYAVIGVPILTLTWLFKFGNYATE